MREDALRGIASGDAARVCTALVRLVLNEPDRAWLEDLVATHLQSSEPYIRGVAATCAGHLARLHKELDTTRLMPLLLALAADPATVGRMNDALDDIQTFIGEA